MKIEGNPLASSAPGQSSGPEATRRPSKTGYEETSLSGAEATASPGTDQVSLSGLSQELSRLTQPDPQREARIEKLAADYDSGKLDADPAKLASKLVDDAFHND